MNEKNDNTIVALSMSFLMIALIASECLIFYNPEARADWPRMLPVAISTPYLFLLSFVAVIIGIISIVFVPVAFMDYILHGGDKEPLMGACVFACGGLIGGGVNIARWIKYIVIDNYPAFGENPNNVYAVAGDTIVYLPMAVIAGVIVGFVLFGLLFLIAVIIKAVVKWL